MADQTIDFGNFGKKITVNPSVPLQLINIKCRNQMRVQATLLGKVYSSHIDIIQLVPVALCESSKVKTIDFAEHQKALENIITVYPTLVIVGVAVTDLAPDLNLALLHTMYTNKQSGFKPQGILNYPIILSVGTNFSPNCQNFALQAYSFNPAYRFCKQLLEVTAFETLQAKISLGEADFESMTPLFQAVRDQQKVVPVAKAEVMMLLLAQRIKQLKLECQKEKCQELKVELRRILGRISSRQCISTEQLNYLLQLTGLQKCIALKMTKFM